MTGATCLHPTAPTLTRPPTRLIDSVNHEWPIAIRYSQAHVYPFFSKLLEVVSIEPTTSFFVFNTSSADEPAVRILRMAVDYCMHFAVDEGDNDHTTSEIQLEKVEGRWFARGQNVIEHWPTKGSWDT